MVKKFGNFSEMGDTEEYLIVSFSSVSLSLQDRWRNNSLSADFLANYWGSFFPVHNTLSTRQRTEVQDTVSYIANELLENAVKFSDEPAGIPIKIGIYLSLDKLRFYVINSVSSQAVEGFQQYIHTLLTEDPGELYIRQLERNAHDEHGAESRLGFLTMLNDYDAQLGWKFETVRQEPAVIVVTTMVALEIIRTPQP